jgi:hypothetical protein
MALRGFLRAHLDSHQVARVLYGAIIGLALIFSLERHPPSANEMVLLLLGTAGAVGLAEIFSDIVGTETRTHRRIQRREVREILRDSLAVVRDSLAVGFGIAFPIVFFELAALGAMNLQRAFDVAEWSGIALTAFYGWSAARLAGQGHLAAAIQAAAVALIGAAVIFVKVLTH